MEDVTSAIIQQIREIDSRDESQIMAELAGETLEDFVYETKDRRGKRTAKLSYVGTRETARAKGNIMLEEPLVTEADDHWRIMVRGTDLANNFSIFGGCHQPKTIKVTDKKTGEITSETDPYAFQKAISKAQRNALTSCIPATLIAKAIDRFLIQSGKQPLLAKVEERPATERREPKADLATLSQMKQIGDASSKMGYTPQDLKSICTLKWGVEKATDLTSSQADELLEMISKGEGLPEDEALPFSQATTIG